VAISAAVKRIVTCLSSSFSVIPGRLKLSDPVFERLNFFEGNVKVMVSVAKALSKLVCGHLLGPERQVNDLAGLNLRGLLNRVKDLRFLLVAHFLLLGCRRAQ
jgi:hypothetical protein